MRLLLISSDLDLARGVTQGLKGGGDHVDLFASLDEGRQALRAADYDLLLLDWSHSARGGGALLSWLRGLPRYTAVVVVGGADAAQCAEALDRGADDWLRWPLDPAELKARVRAIARRVLAQRGDNRITLGGLQFDFTSRETQVLGAPLNLTPREAGVLEVLLLRQGRVVSKEQMRQRLTGFNGDLSNGALELYVHRLRRKLEAAGVRLGAVRGHGYVLRALDQA